MAIPWPHHETLLTVKPILMSLLWTTFHSAVCHFPIVPPMGDHLRADFAPASVAPRPSIPAHILLKLFPFLSFWLFPRVLSEPNAAFLVFLLALAIEFWATKTRAGWDFVGLSWRIDPDPSGSLLHFTNRPAPFLPNLTHSNCFWVGFFLSVSSWALFLLVDAIRRDWLGAAMALFGLSAQLGNFVLFMKAHTRVHAQAAVLTRAAIEGDSVHFALVKDADQESEPIDSSDS
jgi:hypothetical protein